MHDGIRYKNDFLTEVIARVDFPSPVEGFRSQLPSNLTKAALQDFPISEPKKAIARELQVSPKALSSKESEFTEWRFFGKEREKSLTITSSSLFVRYTQYQSFETLLSEFTSVLNAVFLHVPDLVVGRLGLRYINNISLPSGNPLDWDGLIRPEMLSMLAVSPRPEFISRAFNILELNFGDFNIKYQYGMHNPDFPAPIRRRVFVLDLDAYLQASLSHEDILNDLHLFHEKIQTLFEGSISDELREVMRGG